MAHDFPLLDDFRRHLHAERLGHPARGYRQTDSTNQRAVEWAQQGAPEGSIVVAECQTAGRGRLGRSWQASAGHNLLFSVVLRPAFPPERLPLITLAGSVAVAEALAECASQRPLIKWPNDVLIAGRKCCGMLLESSSQGASSGPVVLGVGINVNQDTFPDALVPHATSVLLEAGRPVMRGPLLADVLHRLEARYDSLHCDGGAGVRAAYEKRLAGQGEMLTVDLVDTNTSVRGVLHGINEHGALLLETGDGRRAFHAGEVTLSKDST